MADTSIGSTASISDLNNMCPVANKYSLGTAINAALAQLGIASSDTTIALGDGTDAIVIGESDATGTPTITINGDTDACTVNISTAANHTTNIGTGTGATNVGGTASGAVSIKSNGAIVVGNAEADSLTLSGGAGLASLDGTTVAVGPATTSTIDIGSTLAGALSIKSGGAIVIGDSTTTDTVTVASAGTVTVGQAGQITQVLGTLDVDQAATLDTTLLVKGIITGGVAGTAAGQVSLLAPTAANGSLILKAVDAGGAFNVTLSNAAHGQSTVYSLRDCGAATGIVPTGTAGAAYTQTYATADRTHADVTSSAVATTAATQTSPYGYASAAQADAIPVAINAVEADLLDLKQLVNAVIDDLQAFGMAG